MIIIRLVILAVLAYIGLLLVRGIAKRSSSKAQGADTKGSKKDTKVEDILVEDPVCHSLVPKHQAIRLRKDGKTFYFCSDECCDTFSESATGEEGAE